MTGPAERMPCSAQPSGRLAEVRVAGATASAVDNDGEKAGLAARDDSEPATVDVWHARDVDVMPKQKINAKEAATTTRTTRRDRRTAECASKVPAKVPTTKNKIASAEGTAAAILPWPIL